MHNFQFISNVKLLTSFILGAHEISFFDLNIASRFPFSWYSIRISRMIRKDEIRLDFVIYEYSKIAIPFNQTMFEDKEGSFESYCKNT